MTDEPGQDDYYDELAQRLHENPEQECVPGCWVCAQRWQQAFSGPHATVERAGVA